MDNKDDIKIIKTVYIDNKLKKIYQDFDAYSELENLKAGDVTQDFFDQIFPILWTQGEIKMTNKELGERFGYAESTIEKRVRLLDRVGLITRHLDSYFDSKADKWRTSRTITLDPVFSTMLTKKLKIEPKSRVKMEEKVEVKENKSVTKAENSVQPEKEKQKFVFSRGNRR